MLEKYTKAALNDLTYIKTLIDSNPELIDEPCPDENRNDLWNCMVHLTKTATAGGATIVGSALFPPAMIPLLGGFLYNEYWAIKKDVNSSRSRLNWTLLNYAAENGAIDVALYLIQKGANTDDHFFLKLAERNGHQTFVKSCQIAMQEYAENKAKLLKLQNDISQLKVFSEAAQNSTDKLTLKLISKREKLDSKREKISQLRQDVSDYRQLYEKAISTKDNSNDEQLVLSTTLHTTLTEMHQKIVEMKKALDAVYKQINHKNDDIKEYANKLWKKLQPKYQSIVEQYNALCSDYSVRISSPTQHHFQSGTSQTFFGAADKVNLGPRDDYFYTAEDINILLNLGLSDWPEVYVLGGTWLHETLPGGGIVELLDDFFSNYSAEKAPHITTLLLPINIGEHWVGLNLWLKNGKITSAIYYNSSENKDYLPFETIIKNELKKTNYVAPYMVFKTSAHEIKQPDGTSCGPYLIENMKGDVTGSYCTEHPTLARKIRESHFKWIKEKDPVHFNVFSQQQNALVPNITTQAQSHGLGNPA